MQHTKLFLQNPVAIALSAALSFGASAQTEKSLLRDTGRYAPVIVTTPTGSAPVALTSGMYAANSKVGAIQVDVHGVGVPADGVSAVTVTVRVLGLDGAAMTDTVWLTIENSGGRLQLPDAKTDEFGPGRKDADRTTPGVQLKVIGGTASFRLIAPSSAQDVRLRLTAGKADAVGEIAFGPDLRDMLAIGVVDGVIQLSKRQYDSAVSPVRLNDGFEQELRQWGRSFSSGKGQFNARAAMFLKGKIKGDALLTIAYDSDKETRSRLLQDIRPEEFYPVYGDASIKAQDAQSSGKLYVRVDKNRSFLLYGDFATGEGFSQAAGTGLVAGNQLLQLGAYNRSLTGIKGHAESADGYVNAFVSRDSLKSVVEEIRANGTSGPFAIGNKSALENSEKIEILARDRNDLGRVLSITPLVRLTDYAFEPFSGRILLARPIASQDASGNPLSLRISYEVDQGGQAFWLAGADGQLNLGKAVTVGGSAVKDGNPQTPFQLLSANLGAKLGDKTSLVVELAQTRSAKVANIAVPAVDPLQALDQTTGKAGRVELLYQAETLSGKLYANRADAQFANAAAGTQSGTERVGGEIALKVSTQLSLNADVKSQYDIGNGARRSGLSLGGAYKLSEKVSLNAGLRYSQENGLVSGSLQSIGCNPAPGSAFEPGSAGGFTPGAGTSLLNLNGAPCAAPSALGAAGAPGSGNDQSSTSLYLGATVKLTDQLSVNARAEMGHSTQTSNTATRLELGASYQLAERTRLYLRAEDQRGLASQYALSSASKSSALSFGIDSTYMEDGNVFSEYRLRDAVSGKESQLATGVRNAWHVTEGITLTTGAERLKILDGSGQNATAITLGADYTASALWKASGRLEWRRLDGGSSTISTQTGLAPRQDTWLSTLSVARKLDRDWTLLAKNYLLLANNFGARPDGYQDRFQLGAAFRPVDYNQFDALLKYEYKTEDNINATNEFRKVHVGAVQANYHPSRPWWVSGRMAAKWVNEGFPSTEGGGRSSYKAYLLSGRGIYDISERWDLGLLASFMSGRDGTQSGRSVQKALGLELGYAVATNLWLSGGYNWAGFTDPDLTSDYTSKGVYLRLRYKFDKDLFNGKDGFVNPSLSRP